MKNAFKIFLFLFLQYTLCHSQEPNKIESDTYASDPLPAVEKKKTEKYRIGVIIKDVPSKPQPPNKIAPAFAAGSLVEIIGEKDNKFHVQLAAEPPYFASLSYWIPNSYLSFSEKDIEAGKLLSEMRTVEKLPDNYGTYEELNKKMYTVLCKHLEFKKTANSLTGELELKSNDLQNRWDEFNQDCENGPPDWRDECKSIKILDSK